MIRFALIGSGSIAEKHAQAITAAAGAELAAVWARRPGQGTKFAEAHGAEFVDDIALLASREDIHAAAIATPSGAHAEGALPFLEQGKAVLCEKPLDISLQKIDSMLAAAQNSGATLAAVLQLRLGTGAQAMKRAVEDGRFGRLTLCSAYLKWWREQSYYDSVNWRGTVELDGGGALMNQGVHAVDLLQWLAGMPTEVSAFAGCLAHERIEVEDTAVIALKYPNGAMGVIEASTACKPGCATRIELCGDRGSAVLEDDRIVRWEFDEEKEEDETIRSMKCGAIKSGSSDPNAIGFGGHRVLVEDLIQALRDKRQPMISGKEARKAVLLILASYKAAKLGRTVEVNSLDCSVGLC